MKINEKILSGKTSLGIEFGSTRIKAVLIDDEANPIASGSHTWKNLLNNYSTKLLLNLNKIKPTQLNSPERLPKRSQTRFKGLYSDFISKVGNLCLQQIRTLYGPFKRLRKRFNLV